MFLCLLIVRLNPLPSINCTLLPLSIAVQLVRKLEPGEKLNLSTHEELTLAPTTLQLINCLRASEVAKSSLLLAGLPLLYRYRFLYRIYVWLDAGFELFCFDFKACLRFYIQKRILAIFRLDFLYFLLDLLLFLFASFLVLSLPFFIILVKFLDVF